MKYLIVFLVLFVSGCATTNTLVATSDTMRIIESAAAAAPEGVPGDYRLQIKTIGRQEGYVFLNTELDYRDPRNVTVAIPESVAHTMADSQGQQAEMLFRNQSIQVSGEAKRVRIIFNCRGRPSGKYYFQTHIRVSSPDQIQLLGTI